jgi:hypothetical protein
MLVVKLTAVLLVLWAGPIWAQQRDDSSDAQRHNIALTRTVHAFDTLTFSAKALRFDSIALAVASDSDKMKLLDVFLVDAWLSGYRRGQACGMIAAVHKDWAEAIQRLTTEKACLPRAAASK